MSFTDLLFKSAQVADLESQEQLEHDFSQLSFTFLRDRAPDLLDYLLGFEIVEEEDDGSKAVGIFGCKIGEKYYYVPAFFINNQIKGVDLLYNRTDNLFMPLQENWISDIINKQVFALGTPTRDPEKVREDFEQADFGFLKAPEAKMASDESTIKISKDINDAWKDMITKLGEMLDNDKDMQSALAGAYLKLDKENKILEKTAEDSSLLKYFENHGGPAAVHSVMNTLGNQIKYANAALSFYPSVESMYVHKFNMEPKEAKTKLKVITRDLRSSAVQCPADLSDDAKKTIVRDGFFIEDLRDPKEKSEMFCVDYTKNFSGPSEPGFYDVLLTNGATSQAWILSLTRPSKAEYIIVEPKTKTSTVASPKNIIVKGEKLDSNKSLYQDAITSENVSPNNTYIAINDKLKSTMPFGINRIEKARESHTEFKVYPIYNEYDPEKDRDSSLFEESRPDVSDIKSIQIGSLEGDSPRMAGNKLIIPKNWKFLKINTGIDINKPEFKPGSLLDLDEALFKSGLHKLVVEYNGGSEYIIDYNSFIEGPYNYKKAAVHLVKDYGFDVDDVISTLKEASNNIKSRRLVKLAQVGVAMPSPAPQEYGVDPYTGVATMAPQEQMLTGELTGVPSLRDPMQKGINIGGETPGLEGADLAQEIVELSNYAAETGQKTIFDHSTIGGLSQLYDVSSAIDTYVPDLVKSLDRVGRILFLFYWQNSEFVDRYGDEKLSDFEDLLRNVFVSFGDLVLKLKQKVISAGAEDVV